LISPFAYLNYVSPNENNNLQEPGEAKVLCSLASMASQVLQLLSTKQFFFQMFVAAFGKHFRS